MKLSQKLLKDDPYHLTPPPGSSGTSMSFKTPGRYLIRQLESWQGFWCWILMKLSQKLLNDDPYHMTPPPGSSTSISSKTPGKDLEDMESLGERLSQSCYPGLAISATLSWSYYLGLAILVMLSWSCYLGLTISISLSQSHYPSLAIKVSLSQ